MKAIKRYLRKRCLKASPKGNFYAEVHPSCPPELYAYAIAKGYVVRYEDPDYQEFLRINNCHGIKR